MPNPTRHESGWKVLGFRVRSSACKTTADVLKSPVRQQRMYINSNRVHGTHGEIDFKWLEVCNPKSLARCIEDSAP